MYSFFDLPRKLICFPYQQLSYHPEDKKNTENKNNIVYDIDFSNCETVYLSECKRSLKSRSNEHKRSVKN